MEDRFLEIRFYYWTKKVFTEFRYSYHILDIIDAYCLLGDTDSTLIKQLMQQVRRDVGPISTTKEEAVYIARQLGVSYRDIQDMTDISLATQVRLLDTFIYNYETDHIKPCLSNDYHEAVRRFMNIVDRMKGV